MATREVVVTSTKEATRIGGNVKERVSSYEHHSSSVSESRQSTGVSLISSESGSTTVSKKSGHVSSGTISNESAYAGSEYVLKDYHYLVNGNIPRDEEKKLFISLNERLGRYIKTIQELSLSRDQLALLVQEQKTTETTLRERLDSLYSSRFHDHNHQIEQLKIDNSTLAAELKKALADYEHQHKLVKKLETELHRIDDELAHSRTQVQELNSQIKSTELRVKEFEKINLDLRAGATDYQKRLDDVRHQIEQEVKKGAQWEGKYLTVKADLDLAQEVHKTILENRTQKHKVEVDAIISRMRLEYDARLIAALHALRTDFDNRLKASKLELSAFKFDFSAINFDSKHIIEDANKAKAEASALRARIHELENLISAHDSTVVGLKRRVTELESSAHYTGDFGGAYKQSLITLQNEVNEMRSQYRYLMGIKLQLDSEINAYHALLEGEEYRLSIYNVVPAEEDHTGRAFVSKGHSDVDLLIDEINMLGNYIHFTNKGNKDFHLESWMIKAESGGLVRKFKFQTDQVVSPGKSMTIWSPNRGGTHNPPDSIVMKAVVWPSGDRIHVELLDENEKMRAWLTAYYELDEISNSSKSSYIM